MRTGWVVVGKGDDLQDYAGARSTGLGPVFVDVVTKVDDEVNVFSAMCR